MPAGTRRQARRPQLGLHSAAPQGAGTAAGHRIELRIIGTRLVDQLGIGIVARIGVEHPVAIGKDHQQVGLDQVGHQCRQGVVVAEADLVGDHRVVLVDHRDHAQLDQGPQGAAGVQVALAVGEVVMGQQHLGGLQAMQGEAGLPGLHQPHLPHRGGGLEFVHRARSGHPAQAAHTGGDGAGRHQHQLDAGAMQRHHLLDPNGHGIAIQPTAIGRQQGATDLHHPAPRASHLVPHTLNLRSPGFDSSAPPARPAGYHAIRERRRSPDRRRHLPHHRNHRHPPHRRSSDPNAAARAHRPGPADGPAPRPRYAGRVRPVPRHTADLLPGAGYARRDSA